MVDGLNIMRGEYELVKSLTTLFEDANSLLIANDQHLIQCHASERSICASLLLHLRDVMNSDNAFAGYYVDAEYNRRSSKLQVQYKTIKGPRNEIIRITCDLIVHGRGAKQENDNLIAIEMKKSDRSKRSKDRDRDRLKALTSLADIRVIDGVEGSATVSEYVLGIYYELNLSRRSALIEYYHKGEKIHSQCVSLVV